MRRSYPQTCLLRMSAPPEELPDRLPGSHERPAGLPPQSAARYPQHKRMSAPPEGYGRRTRIIATLNFGNPPAILSPSIFTANGCSRKGRLGFKSPPTKHRAEAVTPPGMFRRNILKSWGSSGFWFTRETKIVLPSRPTEAQELMPSKSLAIFNLKCPWVIPCSSMASTLRQRRSSGAHCTLPILVTSRPA